MSDESDQVATPDDAVPEGAARPDDGEPGVAAVPDDGEPGEAAVPEDVPLPDQIPMDGGVDGPILIANEFADVVVNRVHTRNGVRLDIWSPRRGTRVQLDAVELDCLSYQDTETFTEMLARKPGG